MEGVCGLIEYVERLLHACSLSCLDKELGVLWRDELG